MNKRSMKKRTNKPAQSLHAQNKTKSILRKHITASAQQGGRAHDSTDKGEGGSNSKQNEC